MTKRQPKRARASKPRATRRDGPARAPAASLKAIVAAGLLRPPIRLMSQYREQSLSAIVQIDGSILVDGVRCTSPTSAAAKARKPHDEARAGGGRAAASDGWTFWHVQDPACNEMVPLEIVRERYRQRKRFEAERRRGGVAGSS